ncbi:MAG: bifunctional 5,10-methylenetetrahydrofolate dehydrogenase/5,10-methenyltetrahydrofolate cyclohydrolase [Candidatus Dojkabacteria bacterium]|nr:bifunctional 5,10-methylenetetrahydrofolate dehydrogenase/5,10-methenyltetrahydrofolate cyclohydrolase [Candidatus Dojkabacteria bacterium]
MTILDGKTVSEEILQRLEEEVKNLLDQGHRVPRLDIIIVGHDFASEKYVSMKEKKGQKVGIKIVLHKFEDDAEDAEIISLIRKLNEDSLIDGIMVQLPLTNISKTFNTKDILESIDVSKDVDGLTYSSLGAVWVERESIGPATPTGIIKLLNEYDIDVTGKNVVVVGRSKIVGLPLAAMLSRRDATVTVAHSKSENLPEICKEADILAVGIGKPKYINRDYIKKGAIVIDIGINRDYEGNLVGDVDFEEVKDHCSYITPVPGGVGPMTIASLFSNLIKVYKRNVKRY